MENGQKKLKELFDGRKIFNIPAYQRAYAWDVSRHLPDFLEDIENQSLSQDYFLGTILFLEQSEKEAGFDLIDIVDGQQRITTIIIFMKVLLDVLKSRMTQDEFQNIGLDLVEETYIVYKNRPKLRAISPDNDFFQNYVIGDSKGADNISTPSQRRLFNAKTYFATNLESRSIDDLLLLKQKLDERSKVLTYSVKDAAEATLIFETTNDRGKSLTNLEKIKSFLMYKICLAAGDEIQYRLNAVQERFSDIFREVELFNGQPGEDSVLQYHFIAFENWTDKSQHQNPISFIRAKLNGLVNSGQHSKAVKFIDEFSLRLKESYRIMRDLLSSTSPFYRDLICLNRMGSFYPLLMKSYKLDHTDKKLNFEKVCRFLEIFSVRVLALGRSRSDAGQEPIHVLAREFGGKFTKLFDELGAQIERLNSRKRFIDALASTQIYDEVKSNDLSYLLWKYENHLRESEQPVCPQMSEAEFLNDGRKKCLTIEHIASQNPNKVIRDREILSGFESESLIQHIHRLGNLTFDPASANSSKGNGAIEVKNSKYFAKAPYKTQNELENFMVDGKWNENSIDERQKKIMDFCLIYWNPEHISY